MKYAYQTLFALLIIVIALLFPSPQACAQEPSPVSQYSKAIEDNSYLVEEAYNQEPGVIQHISNGIYFRKPGGNFIYSFTEEIPVTGQAHQFGFTLPYASLSSGASSGLGDILINYRYQLMDPADWAAVAPRLSIILPTGDEARGLGDGVTGLQLNIPASKRLSESFVAHANAGMTLLPGVEGADALGNAIEHTLPSYNFGISLIWLALPQCNFMLEAVQNIAGEIDGTGEVAFLNETIINPGIRYAIDVNDLQIVPGLAFPLTFADGESRSGMFFYLSFEHPW